MVSLESYFKVSLEKELEEFPKLKIQDIAELQEWLSTQPHLPQFPAIQISYFLHKSCYDVDKAKRIISANGELKRTVPQFFGDWDPLSKEVFDQAKHVCYFGFLPKLGPLDPRFFFIRYKENSVKFFDFASHVKWVMMSVQSLLFQDGLQEELKMLCDSSEYTFSICLKHPLNLVKKYQEYSNNASPLRVNEFHILNSNTTVRRVYALYQMFGGEDSKKKYHFYAGTEFFKNLPPEVVPWDYGGTGPSVETLHDENTNRVLKFRDALIAYNNLKPKDLNKKV